METALALQNTCRNFEYNLVSHSIKNPWHIFIISIVTIRLIGIIVLSNKKYVKKVIELSDKELLSNNMKFV